MENLPVKMRPKTLAEVIGQEAVVSVLSRQIATGKVKNAYLFCGEYGTGKTTVARILANMLNDGVGEPIEIDAASNNGVDNIRDLIADAQQSPMEGNYKTYVIDECVTGDTEVLTGNGWVRFDSLTGAEKVAQYTDCGGIEFVSPTEFIKMPYSGDIYNVHIGNKATFSFTPNHVQPLMYIKSGKIKESYIKDIKFCQSNRIIRSGYGVGSKDTLSYLDRVSIALQADGNLMYSSNGSNYWTIQVKKESKKIRLLYLLENSGLDYREIKSGRDGITRYSVKTGLSITKKLSTHFNLLDFSHSYAKDFIDEILKWDGYVSGGKYLYYSCSDKENVDFCQCAGVLGGFSSRVSVEKDKRKETYSDIFRLYLQEKKFNNNNAYVKKEKQWFCGDVYCVKVPSHKILIRRDGYEMVTGNCHNLSKAAWDCALKLIEEPPAHAVFIFCTTNPLKVPDTIMSRVQRFDFRRVSNKAIADRLEYICNEELDVPFEREAIERIAVVSKGHVRQAIQDLQKCVDYTDNLTLETVENILGVVSEEAVAKFVSSIFQKNLTDALTNLNNLIMSNTDAVEVYDSVCEYAIDSAIYAKIGDIHKTGIISEYKDMLTRDVDVATVLVDRLMSFRGVVDKTNAEAFLKTVAVEICR